MKSNMMNRGSFIHFFKSETRLSMMQIPMSFIKSIGRPLPKRVFLRDRYENWWCLRVRKVGEAWYFKKGWQRFVRDNKLKTCELIVFDYVEKDMFDFKILGLNQTETIGAGGLVYYENDRDNDVFEDELDEEEEEEEEDEEDEEWDFGGDDDVEPCAEDEYHLTMKQKFQSKVDDDDWIDDRLFVEQQPKSEYDDSCGISEVHVKKEPKHERDRGHYVCVKRQPKHEGDDVTKKPKHERDDGCDEELDHGGKNHDKKNYLLVIKTEPKEGDHDGCHENLDDNDYDFIVGKEPWYEGDNGHKVVLDYFPGDNTHYDMENQDNKIMNHSTHLSEDVDNENDDDTFIEEEPPTESNSDSDYVVDVDDEEEIEEASHMLNEESGHEEYAPKQTNKVYHHKLDQRLPSGNAEAKDDAC